MDGQLATKVSDPREERWDVNKNYINIFHNSECIDNCQIKGFVMK